jgi:hypothetical protein
MSNLSSVFVVTRNGRRIEDINYSSRKAAQERAVKLRSALATSHQMLGLSKEGSEIVVKEVEKPNKIW